MKTYFWDLRVSSDDETDNEEILYANVLVALGTLDRDLKSSLRLRFIQEGDRLNSDYEITAVANPPNPYNRYRVVRCGDGQLISMWGTMAEAIQAVEELGGVVTEER